jgi:hypothetical protein
VKASDSIYSVKTALQFETRIPRGIQILSFAGTRLDDERTISYYNIKTGSALDLEMGLEVFVRDSPRTDDSPRTRDG